MSWQMTKRVLEEARVSRPWATVLLAMADHADENGGNCFPSVDRIAWMANYKPRQVVTIIRELEDAGVLIRVGEPTRYQPTSYRINIDAAPKKMPFGEWAKKNGRHAGVQNQEGVQNGVGGMQKPAPRVQNGVEDRREIAPEPPVEPSSNPQGEPVLLSSDAGQDDSISQTDLFQQWYERYPRKIKRARAEAAWKKIAPDAKMTETMIDALEKQKRSRDWTKDDGQFIPHPSTWLNDRRWEDEVPEPAQTDDEWLAELAAQAEAEALAVPDTIQNDDDVIEVETAPRPETPPHIEEYQRATAPVSRKQLTTDGWVEVPDGDDGQFVDHDDEEDDRVDRYLRNTGMSEEEIDRINRSTGATTNDDVLDDLASRYPSPTPIREEADESEFMDDDEDDDDPTSPYVEGSTDGLYEDDGWTVIGGR